MQSLVACMQYNLSTHAIQLQLYLEFWANNYVAIEIHIALFNYMYSSVPFNILNKGRLHSLFSELTVQDTSSTAANVDNLQGNLIRDITRYSRKIW